MEWGGGVYHQIHLEGEKKQAAAAAAAAGGKQSSSLFVPYSRRQQGGGGEGGGLSHDVGSHDQSKASVCDPRGEKIKDVCILNQPAGPFYSPLMLTQLIDSEHHASRQTHR